MVESGKMLIVSVEGETEEHFVNHLLGPFLYAHGFSRVQARLMGKRHSRGNRGGIIEWKNLKRELRRHLKQSAKSDWFVTTMFDYYGLEGKGYPRWEESKSRPYIAVKADVVCMGMQSDLQNDIGDFVTLRFIPFVMMYEFEGLLFTKPEEIANVMGKELEEELTRIRNRFDTPEHINNNVETAPSKRLLKLKEDYNKVLDGNRIAAKIGFEAIRTECRVFDSWITSLINL